MEEQLVYNNDILKDVPIYDKCHSFLRKVSEKDYPDTVFFNPEIECLDMDHYEKNVLCTPHAGNTVDAVIGIESYKGNRFSNARLMLVELRMGYESVNNLSKTIMSRKVEHAKVYLIGRRVEKKSFFIFSETLIHQAKRWFDSYHREGGSFVYCIPVSVSEFDGMVYSKDNVPVVYIHSEEDIRRDIESKEKPSEFIAQVSFWLDKSREYRYKGKQNECDHIMSVVKELWKSFKNKGMVLSESDELNVEILEEDYFSVS